MLLPWYPYKSMQEYSGMTEYQHFVATLMCQFMWSSYFELLFQWNVLMYVETSYKVSSLGDATEHSGVYVIKNKECY